MAVKQADGTYRDEDDDLDQSWGDLAGLHPAGDFPCVVAQLPKFRAIKKDFEKNIIEDYFWVFSLQTMDEDGVRRVIDTKDMTGKPYSGRSDMGKLLKAGFGQATPAQVEEIMPRISSLLGRNFMVTVKHEQGASGTVYANVSTLFPIQKAPTTKRDENNKVIFEPVYAPFKPDASYQDFFERKANLNFQRVPKPSNPAQMEWFKPLWEPKEDEGQEVPAYAGAQPEAAPPQAKAAAGASKAKSKF